MRSHGGAGESEGTVVVLICGHSEIGRVRDHNEDTFRVEDLTTGAAAEPDSTVTWTVGERGIFLAVCDGMGGHAAGEDASRLAIEIMSRTMRGGSAPRGPVEIASRVVEAVQAAGRGIFDEGQVDFSRRGMGTTATLAVIIGRHLVVGQIGDSRAYVLRGDRLVQITRDQSLVTHLIEAGQLSDEEARTFVHANVITQALAPHSDVDVDVSYVELRRGDTIVVSSDGLHGLMPKEELHAVLRASDEPRAACLRLAERANEAGGNDNITLVVAKVDAGVPDAEPHEVSALKREGVGEAAPQKREVLPFAPAVERAIQRGSPNVVAPGNTAESRPRARRSGGMVAVAIAISTACACVGAAAYLLLS